MKFLKILSAIILLFHLIPSNGKLISTTPLFMAIILFWSLYYLIKYTRTLLFVSKIKKVFRDNFKEILKVRVALKSGYIIAEGKSTAYFVRFLHGVNNNYRYHFDTPYCLNIFKTTHTISHAGTRSAPKFGETMTRRIGKKKYSKIEFDTKKDVRNIFLMELLPDYISDTCGKLIQGQSICKSDVAVYSIDAFERYIKED